MTAAGQLPVLWQLRFSHYNEKARWALDYKGIAHERRSLAPGMHRFKAKRLGGRTTPILVLDDRTIGDSAEIIAELERRHPDPALYPADSGDRQRALELAAHFDRELGPQLRGALFDSLIPDRKLLLRTTTQGLGPGSRAAMTATYPFSRSVIRRQLVDSVGGREESRRGTLAALDRLETELDGGDYLAGGSFSVADLTAAALFAPLVAPPEFAYEMPERWPPDWEAFREPLAGRRGWRWVEQMYRHHRGTSAATLER